VLQVNQATRYLLYHKWADMRKSFDGLCGLVTNELNMTIKLGDVFIFFNKRQTHIKLLQWEGDGFSLYYKRLEAGTFEMPGFSEATTHSVITARQLLLILQGISLRKAHYRKRYIAAGSV
jgi:transposase